MNKTFKFSRYDTAIHYHITRVLEQQGWQKSNDNPQFSDQNLTLNDGVSIHFEYKHLLAELINNLKPSIMPATYSLDDTTVGTVLSQITLDYYLQDNKYHKEIKDLKWLLKPSMLNNGDDIKLFNNLDEVREHYWSPERMGGDHILQQYIPNPALHQGRKYTFRVFAALTNYAGVYLYREGYGNISADNFNLEDRMGNRKAHITNYILDGELANIEQRLASELCDFKVVYQQMVDIVQTTVKQIIKRYPQYLKTQNTKKVELFGYDFMLDTNGKLWLIEINQGPDCPMIFDHVLNESLWYPFWQDVVNDFVLPIATEQKQQQPSGNFQQVLETKQCYSRFRDLLGCLKF
tara:strand:+ start:107194 stop:108240 length:1047 start_codon:yes stop_codon:yes gene_type:complete